MSNMPVSSQRVGGLPASFMQGGPVAAFQQSKVDGADLEGGIGSSFAVVSIRGKVWRVKHRGDENAVVVPSTVPGGNPTPAPTIEVVMIKASPVVSKIWYESGYVEGSAESPDCFSVNGVAPDPTSPKKQCESCAVCPRNQWGSSMTPGGKAAKSCQDSKRIAVSPLLDLRNEAFGGPMLLRVPPGSLQDMAGYSGLLQQHGHKYYTCATQLSFDINTAHPKIVFSALRPLTTAEAEIVLELQEDTNVNRMLSDGPPANTSTNPGTAAPSALQGPQGQPSVAQPTPAVVTMPIPAPTAATPPLPVPTPAVVAPAATVVVAQTGEAGSDPGPIPQFLMKATGPTTAGQPTLAQPVAPPPPPAPAPAPPPPPPPPVEVPYQFTPDGRHRWRPGMVDWELVPPAPDTAVQAVTAGVGRGRGTRKAAASPSPAPTATLTGAPEAAAASTLAPASVIVSNGAGPGANGDAAAPASVDAKLAALLGS